MGNQAIARKWARNYAAFPAIVGVACSLDDGRSAMAYSFHCVTNGEVVLAPAGQLGEPSLTSVISSQQRLIVAAYTNRYSKLSAPELDRALEHPDDWGHLAFCLSRTQTVLFSPEERASLVDSVIDSLCADAIADPQRMLLGRDIAVPALMISKRDARLGIRPSMVTPWFRVKCRLTVRAAVSNALDELLTCAHERCDQEQSLAAVL